MHRVYTIVKKNSQTHQQALASKSIKNAAVLPVGDSHVLVPSIRSLDFGHNVSHAKNRTKRVRYPNLRSLKVSAGQRQLSIRLSASDLRTYKKLTTGAQQE